MESTEASQQINKHLNNTEQRRLPHLNVLTTCDVDMGFDNMDTRYTGEVLNIDEEGLLLRAPLRIQTFSFIYDYASLTLRSESTPSMKAYGQVVRIDADRRSPERKGPAILVAFEFRIIRQQAMDTLKRYISMGCPGLTRNSEY